MRRIRSAGGLLLAGVLAAVGGVAAAGSPKEGDVFPAFDETDMVSGKPLKLESFRGKVVVIDFWATWCGPCVAEIPNLKQVYAKYHDKGMEVISISLDQSVEKCKGYVEKNKMNWHHIADGGGWKAKLAKKHGINSIPAMFVIDRDGKVFKTEARGPALAAAVEKALAAPSKNAPKGGKTDKADEKKGEKKEEKAEEKKGETPSSSRPAELLTLARDMATKKNYDLARKYYQRIIDSYPSSDEAITAKAELAKLPAK